MNQNCAYCYVVTVSVSTFLPFPPVSLLSLVHSSLKHDIKLQKMLMSLAQIFHRFGKGEGGDILQFNVVEIYTLVGKGL